MSKKSFLIHIDSLSVIDELTDEQAGQLFRAIKSHQLNEEIELSQIVKIAFSQFKNQFIRDDEKYAKTCEARAAAGSKGGKQKVANASKSKQKVANLADNKNKNDNKKDSDKERLFTLFWENYPRKTDKKKARLAFNKLSQPDKELAIADCKTRYINTEKQYIPHATTYLNGERFNDEVIDGQTNNQQRANTAAEVGDFFEKEANAAARRLSESPDAEVQGYIPAKVGRTIQDH